MFFYSHAEHPVPLTSEKVAAPLLFAIWILLQEHCVVAGTIYKELLSLTCFPNESFNQLRNNTNTTLQWVN